MFGFVLNVRKLLRKCDSKTPLFGFQGQKKLGKVVSVYYGDSVTIAMVVHGDPVLFKCRIEGVDTPEMKPPLADPNRQVQMALARKARNRVAQLVTDCAVDLNAHKLDLTGNTKLVNVVCGGFDKYGRLLVTIPSPGGGTQSVAHVLIEEKLGRVYSGGTKQAW